MPDGRTFTDPAVSPANWETGTEKDFDLSKDWEVYTRIYSDEYPNGKKKIEALIADSAHSA